MIHLRLYVGPMTSDERDGRNPYGINHPEIDTGRILQVDEGWLLNPQSTASITLLGSTCETAQAVKRVLEQSYNDQGDSGLDGGSGWTQGPGAYRGC